MVGTSFSLLSQLLTLLMEMFSRRLVKTCPVSHLPREPVSLPGSLWHLSGVWLCIAQEAWLCGFQAVTLCVTLCYALWSEDVKS